MGNENCEGCGREIGKQGMAAHRKACMRKQGKGREKGEKHGPENKTIKEEKQDEGGPAFDAPAKTAVPDVIEKALSEEQPTKSPSAEGEKGGGGEGWIIGGIAGLFGLGALIAWLRR